MNERRPSYYTRLEPFRALFAEGFPILTYHKFGRRPAGVRLRGMYLPSRLLERQVGEWQAAGYEVVGLREGLRRWMELGRGGTWKGMAITVDDGARSVWEEAMPLLERHGVRAMVYLVSGRVGGWNDWEMAEGEARVPLMDDGQVREWLAAGHAIGAHSVTHPWLTRLPADRLREEVAASRRMLEDRFGVEVLDFCYPYGDWDARVRDEVIRAGFMTATTTEFGVNGAGNDWWSLRRITARHASWGWRAVREWLRIGRRQTIRSVGPD